MGRLNNLTPKALFAIDGMGALTSAIFLGLILPPFQELIGMPLNRLHILAIIPCWFAVYDFGCYLFAPGDKRSFLKMIAFANLAYCLFSLALIGQHYQELTTMGLTYFLLEVSIITVLVFVEIKVSFKRG
ncbi:MAG: hypothetical protein ACI85F_002290 [Bacteroidia bacterium]